MGYKMHHDSNEKVDEAGMKTVRTYLLQFIDVNLAKVDGIIYSGVCM